ncbi:MAG: ribosome silencing factor [Desulfobulbaceae bacterium]|nr:MAG: ribosome silencing factor [Desulfobulbaceae bacterium]
MKDVHKTLADKSSLEIARLLSQTALDNKAEDLVILDVHGISSFTDYFVVMSGRSTRHVQGLADAVSRLMSKKRINQSKVEGYNEGQWVLLDYNDVVIHIFYHEARAFYDLEGLWHDAPRVDVE